MSGEQRSARLLRAAVGRGGPVEPTTADWERWFELARDQRVLPLLWSIVETASSDGDLRDRAAEIQLDVMAGAVRLEHALLGVAGMLTANDIRYAVLKGAATAHLDYTDPALRQFGDVDLLVAPSDFARACELMRDAGWTSPYPLPRHHEHFTHAITWRSSDHAEIDLHQRIAHRAIGELVPTPDLLAERTPYRIAGTELWALAAHDRLIHAALHAATSRPPYRRLSSAADVIVLVERLHDAADGVVARADEWKIRPLVEHAIRSSYEAASLPVPRAWSAALATPVTRRDRLVERSYLSERRRPALEELAYLRLLPSWRERARYVGGYFATDAEYAARRGRSGPVGQIRYLWSRLRSGRSATTG